MILVTGCDRLGEHYGVTAPGGKGQILIVVGNWGWAGSAYLHRKRVWLRPIDYAAADRAGPYRRPPLHYANRWRQFKRDAREAARAVYQGRQFEEGKP